MKRAATVLLSILLLAGSAGAASADPLKKLAKRLEKEIRRQQNRKVAVLSFPYHNGATSSGSSIIQERLTTFLAEPGRVEVIERNLIRKILEERNLELTGVIDAQTTQELGKVLGVSTLVTGTLNDLPDERTEVNARAIEAQTGRILAAGLATVERTWVDSPIVRPPTGHAQAAPSTPTVVTDPSMGRPLIQVALLLDTSNSMDGLINQAKTQLWKIVNELASSEKSGAHPAVQVALYEHGNNGISATQDYVRQALPFTTDLDLVSQRLFDLRTNGGEEYAGAAIKDAVANLSWDRRSGVYRTIFIAGNEPFTQGPVEFREAIAGASRAGVLVNTVFCGPRQEGVDTQWQAGAQAGGGEFMTIDQDAQVASVRAPQDDEIERLGAELNRTFIPVGAGGRKAARRQEDADAAAAAAPASGAATQRAIFKAAPQYGSASWDAVSAVEEGRVRADELKAEDLPQELQGMDQKALQRHIEAQAKRRRELQERINSLTQARRVHVARQEREAAQAGGQATLDQVMLGAVRSQAGKMGYRFK